MAAEMPFTPRFEEQLTPNFGYVLHLEEAEDLIKQYDVQVGLRGFTFEANQTTETAEGMD